MNAYNLLGRDIAESLQIQSEYLDRRCVRKEGAAIAPDDALRFGYALNAAVAHIFKGYATHYSKALNQAETAADLDVIAESCTRQLHFAISGAVSNEGKLYQIAELEAHNQIAVMVCGEYLRENFTERALRKLTDAVMRCAHMQETPGDELAELLAEYARLGGDDLALQLRFDEQRSRAREQRAKAERNQKARERRALAKSQTDSQTG